MAWIFLNNAFLSIVTDPQNQGNLLVRARAKGDIEAVFPESKPWKTPARDYAYRATLPKMQVAQAIGRRILGIDYGNFKNSVPENDRHTAYARCWSAMFSFQLGRERGIRMEGDLWGDMESYDGTPLPFPEDNGRPAKKAKAKRTARVRPCQNEGKGSPRRR
jgi:hypothetical protein